MLWRSNGYVDLPKGERIVIEHDADDVYYYAGVVEVADGKVSMELLAGPGLLRVSYSEYEAPLSVALIPVLLYGPSRIVLEALEDSRLWYAVRVVSLQELLLLPAVLSSTLLR